MYTKQQQMRGFRAAAPSALPARQMAAFEDEESRGSTQKASAPHYQKAGCKNFLVRDIPLATYGALERLAKADGRTVTSYILAVLKEHVRQTNG